LDTLAAHEADFVPGRGQAVVPRLLRYVRPYVGLILATVVLSVAYSGGRYARAYLLKPVLDDVVLPMGALSENAGSSSWLPGVELPSLPGLTPEPPPETASAETTPPESRAVSEEERARILENVSASISQVIALAALIILGMPLITFWRDYLGQWVMSRIGMDMGLDACSKLLALPLAFHQDRKRGDILARVSADLGAAHGILSLLLVRFLQASIMLVVGLGALVFVSWKLSLVILVVTPLVAAVISFFGRRITKTARRRQEQMADVTQRLIEILAGIKIIKAFRAERLEYEAYREAQLTLFRRGMRVWKNRVLSRALVDMLSNTASVGVIVLGMVLVLGGHWGLTAGDLAAFAAISVTLYMPMKQVAKGWAGLMDALPSGHRIFEIIDAPVSILDGDGAIEIDGVHEGIRVRDLSFSYGREPVLEHVDFEARAGEVVAIVGRTGAGKTTLIDLLLRFHDPQKGGIEIDGVDLRRIRRQSLLDRIAVVTQTPFLFDGTIADNIRYGRPGASDAEVAAAARAAHVDEFARELPDGYDTAVGTAGDRLSGGQRQRITIARAILRDPAILILDEATSSLDSKSERYVQDAIESLLGGRTVFVIAHRLSTVRRADRILVMEEGRITQQGTHDELVAAGGLYKELVEMQGGTLGGEARVN
jgi:subfamily B ATP-binding cassette protein MsbA